MKIKHKEQLLTELKEMRKDAQKIEESVKKYNWLETQLPLIKNELQTIFDSTPIMIFYKDKQNKMLRVNKTFAETVGLLPKKIVGKTCLELFPKKHAMKYWEDDKKVISSGKPLLGILEEIETSRGTGWARTDKVPYIDGKGNIIGIIGFAVDITKQREIETQLHESEDKYRSIFENAMEGIFQSTPDGRFLTVNPAFARMHGYDSPEEVIQSVVDIEKRFYADPIRREEFVCLLHERDVLTDFEHQQRRKDGNVLWVKINARAVKDANNNILYYEGTAEDITERKQAEKKLKESREQLRRLAAYLQEIREDERTQIAREIHDELGQALTGLKMDISWLKSKLHGIKDTPQNIMEKVDSLLSLTNTTISSTRELASRLRPSMLDDLGLIATFAWQAKVFEERSGIKSTFTHEFDEHSLKKEQITALFRISQECLTNIARHASATEVRVHIKQMGTEIIMEIHDNGKGITKKETSHPASFGLIGMKERARLLKGELSITGSPGEGTTVTVKIPIG